MPATTNNLNFDCDWKFGFNLSSKGKGVVGYLMFWSGCGGLNLTKDIEVWNPYSDTQGQTIVSGPKIKCLGLIESFRFEGGEEDPIRISAYVSKRLAASELVETLERIHTGDPVRLQDAGHGPLVGGDWPGREEGLTARESEVLSLITQGYSNNDIVETTMLSINSIKSYIRSAYRKIGVTSRSRAILWGIDHGFQPDRTRLSGSEVAPSR